MIDKLSTDVAIIGGGIVGSAAALFLRRFGLSVVLLERGLCGAAASGVNYGGVRTQGRAVSQLPLALRARQIWSRLSHYIGIDGEYLQSGHLKIARSEADMASLEAYADVVREHGLDLALSSGAAFRRAYPWAGAQAIGGSFCAEDGHANPRLVSPAFARAARAAGARVLEQCNITEVAHTGSGFVLGDGRSVEVSSRWLLNCAGAWSLDIARRFGDSAPLTTINPGMAVTEAVPHFMDVNVGVEGGGIYGRQTARGNCVMGGSRGAPNGTLYATPTAKAIGELCQRMAELFPALAHAHVIRFWSGVEGSLPDHQPVIGPSPGTPNLIHAFGFCGAGFQTGPAVGELLAELVHHGRCGIDLEPFALSRFTEVPSLITP
ncbi:NAD(P)/FAD-dependent oxidoreductase [Aquabacterium sp.]|uniref:NAD(P)/FAD-dependent oxidoreductase n=1 Tax=Aquabacterium sp. TaxID=1872578 RepID=UPI002BF7791F|nr:FAD-dependent oxidoreductase [Aquabacterium sp.]HSW09267.1 FAD-dependent oxidoreductase [Aquabacterium sp.]